ncbi:MAG: MerR family transcriptional regulator [Candidatus Scalindua sp. AMX11]|nr:MAG: MerR family transcriptional regulator [Candidatus Scalindua sp.]NOG84335.1 MerR family transcriptional regulator [Planctomycetota bacterium]RZV74416.1 MAG: MerR family transcriptional regulator [Candidatus Scalindua sp. SCAELEC01]TDE65336.1 MAG: MerR family transcriptional regulator [Candidatus Scalindua sp. AMX11]
MHKMVTITEVAKRLGITPRTIKRWEKARKVKKAKRNYRGWRMYDQFDVQEMAHYFERGA